MNTKRIFTRLTLAATMALGAPTVFAQDIHFTQFDMAPLVINPAFTGMFDGQVRAGAIYRNQWGSVTVPYVTYGAHVDLPVYTDNTGGYLAAGLQVFNDKAGDGNLQNFTGMASVAYHKPVGKGDLAVGLQGGYAQKSIDLSKLYFGDESLNGTFAQGTSGEYANGIGNSVNYFLVNAGVSLSGAPNENFSYVIGIAANNINQPNDALLKKQTSDVGLDMRYTGQLGLSIRTSGQRLFLRPAVIYQNQASASEVIAGNEFLYHVSNQYGYENFSTAVFLGGWYRTSDAVMITGGIEFKGFRVGVGYDYNISSLNSASNGKGGFEIALRYIAPNGIKFANKRVIPCTRF